VSKVERFLKKHVWKVEYSQKMHENARNPLELCIPRYYKPTYMNRMRLGHSRNESGQHTQVGTQHVA